VDGGSQLRGRAAESGEHGDDAGEEALGVVGVEINDRARELKDVHESPTLQRRAPGNCKEARTIHGAGLARTLGDVEWNGERGASP